MTTSREIFLAKFGHDDHIKDAILSKDKVRLNLVVNRDVMPEKSAKVLYRNDHLKATMLKHIDDPTYIDDAYHDDPTNHALVGAAIQHPLGVHFARNLIKKDNPYGSYLDDAAKNPKLSHSEIDSLVFHTGKTEKHNKIRENALQNPSIDPNTIHKILDGDNISSKLHVLKNPSLSPDHINKSLKDDNDDVRSEAMNSENASSDNIMTGLNDKSENVRYRALNNSNCTRRHYEKAAQDSSQKISDKAKTILSGM